MAERSWWQRLFDSTPRHAAPQAPPNPPGPPYEFEGVLGAYDRSNTVWLRGGTFLATVDFDGDGIFVLDVVRPGHDVRTEGPYHPVAELVSVRGSWRGAVVGVAPVAGWYELMMQGSISLGGSPRLAPYRIQILQPTEVYIESAVTYEFEGVGVDVTPTFYLSPGKITVSARWMGGSGHAPGSRLSWNLYSLSGERYLSQDMHTFGEDTISLEVASGGPHLLAVRAPGGWSIHIEQL